MFPSLRRNVRLVVLFLVAVALAAGGFADPVSGKIPVQELVQNMWDGGWEGKIQQVCRADGRTCLTDLVGNAARRSGCDRGPLQRTVAPKDIRIELDSQQLVVQQGTNRLRAAQNEYGMITVRRGTQCL